MRDKEIMPVRKQIRACSEKFHVHGELTSGIASRKRVVRARSRIQRRGNPGLADLPENCVAEILRYVTPKDIARHACINRTFRAAALSDTVWEAKLPSCYIELLAEAKEAPPTFSSKKIIYDYLCQVVHKNHFEAFWLHKATGAVCRSQDASAMTAANYGGIMDLVGQMDCTLPVGTYTLCWRFQWRRYLEREPDLRLRAKLRIDDRAPVSCRCDLDPVAREDEQNPSKRRVHGNWIEFDGGEFTVEKKKGSGDCRVKLQYCFMIDDVRSYWLRQSTDKFLDGIVIRPTHLKPENLVGLKRPKRSVLFVGGWRMHGVPRVRRLLSLPHAS